MNRPKSFRRARSPRLEQLEPRNLPSTDITGLVFVDTNASGAQDPGELGVSGVTLTLTGTQDAGGSVNLTTTTGTDGTYTFAGLQAGTYDITETQPSGYLSGKESLTGTDSAFDNQVRGIHVDGVAGQVGPFVFGEYVPATVHGTVYQDLSGNGAQDPGEMGISGVTVTLDGTDSENGAVHLTTTTAADGTYSFDGLKPGVYTLSEVQPSGFADGQDALVQGNGTLANDQVTNLTLNGAGDVAEVTFGEGAVSARLGDKVWLDANRNGVQDNGERGIGGVTVKLLDENQAVITTTTTDANGNYLFDGLSAGTYSIQVTPPRWFRITRSNAGGDTMDSDVSTWTGISAPVTLAAGEENLTIDVGLVRTGHHGLGHGFWKQPQHFQLWFGYVPSDSFNDVFGVQARGNPTLLGALRAGGGQESHLQREAVAALLNANSTRVNYLYSPVQVITLVRYAYRTGLFNYVAHLLASQNLSGLDLL